jgi:hypothetical protein
MVILLIVNSALILVNTAYISHLTSYILMILFIGFFTFCSQDHSEKSTLKS